jgi:palmitoyltransferase ZDHHC9/14/18
LQNENGGFWVCECVSHPSFASLRNSHCPWTGNCIGERNHRYFFFFLISLSGLTILVTLTCLQLLLSAYEEELLDSGVGPVITNMTTVSNQISHAHRVWDTILRMPIVVLFGTFCLLCAWSLTSLLCFHALIISLAQTTNERVRNVYQHGRNHNADDHGCWRNWRNALCVTRPPSRLPQDFSQVVLCSPCELPEAVWSPPPEERVPDDVLHKSDTDLDTSP